MQRKGVNVVVVVCMWVCIWLCHVFWNVLKLFLNIWNRVSNEKWCGEACIKINKKSLKNKYQKKSEKLQSFKKEEKILKCFTGNLTVLSLNDCLSLNANTLKSLLWSLKSLDIFIPKEKHVLKTFKTLHTNCHSSQLSIFSFSYTFLSKESLEMAHPSFILPLHALSSYSFFIVC